MHQFDYIQWIKSRLKTLVTAGCVGLALGAIYYLVWPRKYAATASLLVMQAEAKPVHVATESTTAPREEKDDYVATQSGIIASPLIMQRALQAVGPEHCPTVAHKPEPVDAALEHFWVSRPDRSAKILTLVYQARSRLEAVATLTAIVQSYTDYVSRDLYQIPASRPIGRLLHQRLETPQPGPEEMPAVYFGKQLRSRIVRNGNHVGLLCRERVAVQPFMFNFLNGGRACTRACKNSSCA